MAKSKPGSGARFKALENKLSKRKGKKKINDPAALAAHIGMMKFGKSKFEHMSAVGRMKANHAQRHR